MILIKGERFLKVKVASSRVSLVRRRGVQIVGGNVGRRRVPSRERKTGRET